MAHLWSNKKTAVCHSSERRLSPFIVLYLFVYLSLNELMRALQTTLIQFDHNCPQYSIIDVATTETSLLCACPSTAAPLSHSFIYKVGAQARTQHNNRMQVNVI